jgi:isochorismate pyruvate lyase
MDELRAEIDRIDLELVALLAERAAFIDRAVELKRVGGLPARAAARIDQVIANARDAATARGLDPELVTALWRQLVEWSVVCEERELGTRVP